MKNIYFLFIFKLFSRFVGIPDNVQNSNKFFDKILLISRLQLLFWPKVMISDFNKLIIVFNISLVKVFI